MKPLIEPYGIEIGLPAIQHRAPAPPLIEPYGIEIIVVCANRVLLSAFNRTLWN